MQPTSTSVHREQVEWSLPEDHPSPHLPLDRISFLLHRAAGNQVSRLGIGMNELHAQQRTWMLSRFKARVERLPGAGELLELETWPWKTDALRYYRDYRLSGSDGQPLCLATSQWLMVDLERRKPVRVGEITDLLPPVPGKRALDEELKKMELSLDRREERRLTVSEEDLDLNRHVNNARYLQWFTAPLERDSWVAPGEPFTFEIHYNAEARLGDTVMIEMSPIVPGRRVEGFLMREDNRQPLTHFRVY
jgi:medium-chain acyl-[acyl-carrier-protein] hydrolase